MHHLLEHQLLDAQGVFLVGLDVEAHFLLEEELQVDIHEALALAEGELDVHGPASLLALGHQLDAEACVVAAIQHFRVV